MEPSVCRIAHHGRIVAHTRLVRGWSGGLSCCVSRGCWGAYRTGCHVHVARSTVSKQCLVGIEYRFEGMLTESPRVRIPKIKLVRYEQTSPGNLVHVDVKKLGPCPQEWGGHRPLGQRIGGKNKSGGGDAYLHSVIDDHSRLVDSRGSSLTRRRKPQNQILETHQDVLHHPGWYHAHIDPPPPTTNQQHISSTFTTLSPRNEPTHATTTQTPTEPTPTKPGTTPTITTDPTPASEKTLPNAYKISVGTTATEGGILDYEQ